MFKRWIFKKAFHSDLVTRRNNTDSEDAGEGTMCVAGEGAAGAGVAVPRKDNRATVRPHGPTSGCVSESIQARISKEYLHAHVCSSSIHGSQEREATKCPSTDEWIKKTCAYVQ